MKELTPEQKRILLEKGTEEPFSGEFLREKRKGIFTCAQCGTPLFSSDTKFESGSGWPSFFDVVEKGNVELVEDISHSMIRTEVICAQCKGHLGHVFDDGPQVDSKGGKCSGKRYCINSLSLDFKPKDDKSN